MTDTDKSRTQLIDELQQARNRIIELSTAKKIPHTKELELLKEQLLHISQSLPVVCYMAKGDEDFGALFVDPSIEKISGFPSACFTSDSSFFGDRVHPADLKFVFQASEKLLETGRQEVVYRWQHKLGHYIWIADFMHMVDSDDGGPNHIVGIWNECTERMRMEEELRQLQKMESIGTLAGGIAHEFNNIMGVILGNTELYFMHSDEEKRNKCVETIQKSGGRAAKLTQQILTFSRMEPVTMTPFDLALTVEDSLEICSATMAANIEIKFDLQPECATIMGDASQIQQVIINLCNNASSAIAEASGTINVTLRELQEKDDSLPSGMGDCTHLKIVDSGCGMDEAQLESMFDPFFTSKDVGEGTGLGLSVVYGIVKAHEAELEVKSSPGQGTEFSIYFPKCNETAPAEPVATDKDSYQSHKGHIMIVEDEIEIGSMYQEYLKNHGYAVTTCSNPNVALTLFEKNPCDFDLVLTDQGMPSLTGEELSKKMIQIRKDIPIILATGHGEFISQEDQQALGIRNLLSKPIELRTLRKVIKGVLMTENQSH